MSPSGVGDDETWRRRAWYSAAMRISTLLPSAILLAACAGTPSSTPTTSPDPASERPGDQPPADAGGERPKLTAAACEAKGGKVIGDIGDGAIHRPDYRCPDSGEAPIGIVVADPGGPVAVEGSVCCK